jgi:hypothetical protein
VFDEARVSLTIACERVGDVERSVLVVVLVRPRPAATKSPIFVELETAPLSFEVEVPLKFETANVFDNNVHTANNPRFEIRILLGRDKSSQAHTRQVPSKRRN